MRNGPLRGLKTQFAGQWWLPEDPRRKIRGKLRFTANKGGILELEGKFESADPYEPETILGLSTAGQVITLWKCALLEAEMTTYYAFALFLGAHFSNLEDALFGNVLVRYQYLDDWVGVLHSRTRSRTGLRNPIANAVVNGKTISLFRIAGKVWISIDYDKPVAYLDLREDVLDLADLISFVVGGPVYPLGIRGILSAKSRQTVIMMHHWWGAPGPERVTADSMLFAFTEIVQDFESFMRRWYSLRESLGPVWVLFCAMLFQPAALLDQQFLVEVQAVEAYHRSRMKNEQVPRLEHESRLEEILSTAPQRHKAWLEQKLQHSNEPSLRRRLEELLTLPDITEVLEMSESGRSRFIEDVVNTRNRLTHQAQPHNDRGLVRFLVRAIMLILQIVLLRELHFGVEKIPSMVRKGTIYRFFPTEHFILRAKRQLSI